MPPPLRGSPPPRDTLFLGSNPFFIQNGISIGSAVFVWSQMLYCTMLFQLERKPPKLPLHLGISSLCRRRTEPLPWATGTEILVDIPRVVREISSRTNRQTGRHTHGHAHRNNSQPLIDEECVSYYNEARMIG